MKIRFCLVLHNHQPVGNFDHVFEQAYGDSYLPFLDVWDKFPEVRLSLHTSGPLMEWLDAHHPEYVDRLARYVAAGRMEIIGGAFYEPILTMIPSRDRVGQITAYSRWLRQRLDAEVRGMWMPERVWEQTLTSDLAAAGVQYTLLDDFHFKNAGLTEEELFGYYTTEDDGNLTSIFPGSERLRYLIPFGSPQEVVDYLGQISGEHPGAVVVFGDDGEKFGTWPDTKKHVYTDGWLERFFQALTDNKDWIDTTTLADAVANTSPTGKIYLPEGSYREMTEWVLPPQRHIEYSELVHQMEHHEHWPAIQPFVRGGYWRNYKVRYPEANEMYARMMMVSRRLAAAQRDGDDRHSLDLARRELYRGQCNCGYWHGAFGGIYLPHLRNAVYRHLIAAENLLDRAAGKSSPWIEAVADDFNFDARQEVLLADDKLSCLFAPAAGGQMYELDVRSICHNLLATLTRRPEAYHRKVLAGATGEGDECASIHDRVVFKQEGLDERLQYDRHPRKSLLDHFFDHDVPLEAVARGEAAEHGDFLDGTFQATVRRNPDRIQVQMVRDGHVDDLSVRLTKGVTLAAGTSTLEIAYMLEGLPQDRLLHLGVEFNFAGLPSGADDRYFYGAGRQRHGQLGTQLNLGEQQQIGLVDEWLGIDLALAFDQPAHLWTFPVEAVSQSEGGFELIHQSVVVQPHWFIRGDEQGRWSTTMTLNIDTSLAESREEKTAAVCSGLGV